MERAAVFAAIMLGDSFHWNDYVGGTLIVMACLVSGLLKTDDETENETSFVDNQQNDANTNVYFYFA